MMSSAIAGSISTAAGHPMDSLKVRMQTSQFIKQSVFKTLFSVFKTEGLRPFYAGVIPPSAAKAVTCCFFFTANNYLKDLELQRQNKEILSLTETFLIAAFCGVLVSPIISMAEIVKIQLQNDANKVYRNMFDCTRMVIKHKQLHRGMMITSMRLIPGWGIYLCVYDAINRYFDERAVLGTNETLSSWNITMRVLFSGLISGWSAWTCSFPFDYIKTQIQSHPIDAASTVPKIRDVWKYTMKEYGFINGFYRGFTPVLLRSIPVCASHFWVYESVLQIIQNI